MRTLRSADIKTGNVLLELRQGDQQRIVGYRTVMDINAKCPLYEQVVLTRRGNIVGVQCSFLHMNFGFPVSMIMRFRNTKDMTDAKELFCDDMYEACPYYQAYVRAQNLEGK